MWHLSIMKQGGSEPQAGSNGAPAAPFASPELSSPVFSNHAIHLVRTTIQTNLALSQMADQKAILLMGATFVVFTISVGQARGGNFSWSLSLLAFFAFLSAMCAVFAVLPAVHPPERSAAGENILFFGNFANLSEAEFADRVVAQLYNDETVFRTMLRDIHQNGRVMQAKKYRFLGYAYRIFLAGLVITFIAFIVETAMR